MDFDGVSAAHGLGAHFTYAAGIRIADDATLLHTGGWGGYATAFEIRPGRRTTMAVTCNTRGSSAIVLAAELRKVWT